MRTSLAVIAALAIVAAACGGASDSASGVATLEDTAADTTETVASLSDDDASTDAPTEEEAVLAFAACMRDNGIDMEDPTVDADGNLSLGGLRGGAGPGDAGFDRETIQAAFEACNAELDGVALGFRGRGIDQTEREDALLEYAACMRDNGYDMPDPDFDFTLGQGGGGGGTFTGPFGEIDPNDPAFVIAQAACEDLLAGIGRGPGARPGGGGA